MLVFEISTILIKDCRLIKVPEGYKRLIKVPEGSFQTTGENICYY